MPMSPRAARRNGAIAAAVLIAWAAGAAAIAQDAPAVVDRQAGLRASLALTDAAGQPIEAPVAGQLFSLALGLSDAASAAPPVGVEVEGWLRPVSGTDLTCLDAASSFRATRRIPTGGVDLNGVVLFSFNDDGSYGVIDPRLDLASANMLAAGRLGPEPPALAVPDPAAQRVYISGAGGTAAVTLDGRVEALLPQPATALVPDGTGGVWVADDRALRHIGPDGRQVGTLPLEGAPRGARPAGEQAMLAWSAGQIVLARTADGQPVTRLSNPGVMAADAGTITDAQGGTTTILALLTAERRARIVFADAVEGGQDLDLPAPATRVDLQPGGTLAMFWDPMGTISFVDAAAGTVSGALAIHAGISAVAWVDRAVFLMTPDGSGVTVVDLASIGPGKAPVLREVRIGPRSVRPAAPAASAGLIASLAPAPRVMAVNPDLATMFVVEARDAMGEAPPMTGGQLRGGRPRRIAVLDRSFRPAGPGRFVTRAFLPVPGEWELVLTTGIGGLSTCFRMTVAPDPAAGPQAGRAAVQPARLAVTPEARAATGGPVRLQLSLSNDEGARVAFGADPMVTLTALDTGWRGAARVSPDATGIGAEIDLPNPGLYLVRVEGPTPVSPAVIEIP